MRTCPFTSKLVMTPLFTPLSTIVQFSTQTETRAIVKVNRDIFIRQKHNKHRRARINITVLRFKVEVLKTHQSSTFPRPVPPTILLLQL